MLGENCENFLSLQKAPRIILDVTRLSEVISLKSVAGIQTATWDRECMSTPPPFAAFPSQCRQWVKHGTLLRKGTSKNIKVFILFRFTEFEKMLPFYKNTSVFVYRSRQSDESIEM